MNEYKHPGKDTVRVGDTVRVASATVSATGHAFRDPGWTGGKVLRFLPSARYGVAAEVTHPRRAGTRVVAADRLTHSRKRV